MRRLTLSIFLCLAVPGTAAAAGSDAIIVKRVSGLDASERAAVRSDADVQLVDTLPLANTEVVVPRDGDVGEALAELDANPDVVYAERDLPASPATNDTHWGLLWGLPKISLLDAWTRTRGAGATVAVVDSGVQLTHPDLTGQFTGNPGEQGNGRETNGVDDDNNGFADDWQGWDFVNGDNTVEAQSHSHGSHVAGTIAALADNNTGIAGVAPAAKIVPVKVFGAPGSQASSSIIASAFDYAGALGVPVVNASLGGVGYSTTVANAINAHPNTLYVIAAGNDGANAADYYPCNAVAANVVCVGATDSSDAPADFSNTSATAVDLFAPGVDIASTTPTNAYVYMDGTSMATPHVAGAAALLAAARPGATSAQLKTALLGSVDVPGTLTGLAVTNGRLDAAAAMDALVAAPGASPTPSPTPSPTVTPPPTATPTPAPPAPPAPTPAPPAPTPTPPTTQPVVSGLKVKGKVSARTSVRVTFSLSAATKVAISVHRKCGAKACASAVSRWSESAKSGAWTFSIGRKINGRKLRAGKYNLTVATIGGSRTVTFQVR